MKAVLLSSTILAFLLSVSRTANAEIRCTSGTIGSTCPDIAPVCCFVKGHFTLGCCREDEVCKENGCAPAPPTNSSFTGLTDSNVDVHLSTSQVLTWLFVGIIGLWTVFMIVLGAAQISKRLDERVRRRAAERARAAEPNSDDEAVDSDDERTFRKSLAENTTANRSENAPLSSTGETGSDSPRDETVVADEKKKKADDDAQQPKSETTPSSSDDADTTDAAATTVSIVNICLVCKKAPVDCLILDCYHSACCYECAKHLKYCPECKQKIRRRKHIFL